MGLSHSPKIATNGLMLAVDAANIKSYPGSGTTWIDLSPNINNGTFRNSPTYDSSNGGSLVFATNKYIDVGNSSSISPATAITIESWVNLTSFSSQGNIVNKNGNGGYRYRVNSSGKIQWFINYDAYTTANFLTSIQTISTNIWYQIVVTGTSGSMQIYVNGILDNSKTGVTFTINYSQYFGSANGQIGASTLFGEYFNGKISSVKLYNRVLSADEILQNFNALRGRYGI